MNRRDFLLGLTAGTAVLLLPEEVQAAGILSPGNNVSFKCLGTIRGPRYLDGRTANATVGLAPISPLNLAGQSGASSMAVRLTWWPSDAWELKTVPGFSMAAPRMAVLILPRTPIVHTPARVGVWWRWTRTIPTLLR